MTGQEMAELVSQIGKSGVYYMNGLRTHVKIVDVKTAYGKAYYLIKTSMGDTKWTTEDCVGFLTSEKAQAVYSVAKEVLKGVLRPW